MCSRAVSNQICAVSVRLVVCVFVCLFVFETMCSESAQRSVWSRFVGVVAVVTAAVSDVANVASAVCVD